MGEVIMAWAGEVIDVAGREIHVRRAPAPGLPAPAREHRQRAVYVHGLSGFSSHWTDLMWELRDQLAGAAPDLPGFGDSPPPTDGDYGMDAHAATLARLISDGDGRDARTPVHLIGNSLGAALATRVAAEHPELVRTLTLISPALPETLPQRVPLSMIGALVPLLGPAVYGWMQSRPAEVRVQGMLDLTCYDPTAVPVQRVLEAVRETREWSRREHAIRAAIESLRGIVVEYLRRDSRALWHQAAGVSCPTLLVYGRHDRLVNVRAAERAARVFRRSKLVVLRNAGHTAMLERPATVAREIRAFLRDPVVTRETEETGETAGDPRTAEGAPQTV